MTILTTKNYAKHFYLPGIVRISLLYFSMFDILQCVHIWLYNYRLSIDWLWSRLTTCLCIPFRCITLHNSYM